MIEAFDFTIRLPFDLTKINKQCGCYTAPLSDTAKPYTLDYTLEKTGQRVASVCTRPEIRQRVTRRIRAEFRFQIFRFQIFYESMNMPRFCPQGPCMAMDNIVVLFLN